MQPAIVRQLQLPLVVDGKFQRSPIFSFIERGMSNGRQGRIFVEILPADIVYIQHGATDPVVVGVPGVGRGGKPLT